ncbi:MAG: CapA family protein [Clostridia bacterium]|nr:CapA family protein [Clostridia bacterium]
MRLSRLLILLLLLLLPCIALADTTITLTFAGDVTLGGEEWLEPAPESFASLYEKNGPEYFLGNFAEFFAEDDLTVINLEGVLSDADLRPVQSGKKGSYFFKGKTEYVNVLTSASVEAASIANNHIYDYGEKGLRDTIATLEGAGIEWFGTRDRHTTDTERFFFFEKDGVTICLLSLYWDDYLQGNQEGCGAFLADEIKRIKDSGEAAAVIAILHGGQEYGRHATKPQQVFTKMAFGAGADLVICHHAHVVLGMDVIGNRSAFYSLGNFCFGGNRLTYQKKGSKVQDAAPALIVRAELTFDDEGKYKGQQMTLYPVQTTSIDRPADSTEDQVNDYQPKFITGPLGAHVLHLLQWDTNWNSTAKKHRTNDPENKALRDFIISKEEELVVMESSEGMFSLTLPYLPAEAE